MHRQRKRKGSVDSDKEEQIPTGRQVPDGHEQDGYEQDGHGQDGHGQDGHAQDGYEQDGHGQDGHEQDGHGQEGHEQDSVAEDCDSSENYGTPIRSRKRFTAEETRILEKLFEKATRPPSEAKQNLATQFDTTSQRIQIWFQNRRAKEKKRPTEGSSSGYDGSKEDVSRRKTDGGASSSADAGESSRERGESGRKRRRTEDDAGAVPLRPNIPFYHPPNEPYPGMPHYPFNLQTPYQPNMIQREGKWYQFIPPTTVNPADIGTPDISDEQFTLVEPNPFYNEGYTDDVTSLELLAETSQQQTNTEESSNVSVHEEDQNLPDQGDSHALNQHK